ncbi:DnaJ-like protein DjlA [Anaerobiospirillum thomasii]|uniref:co-chaperone DjlA n=1 Tax=Anaerobiospirillum thomasii TaxID=179995 RepID=UPI000D8FD4EE|nr:co-chaperone DjlA [Anaerobiospirillum thomasii]SPT68640.1 DnaJ-like protein DjlA [Anaerobiospirillum thomasii]
MKSYKGRVIGALIGLFLSPIGALIGFAIGYYFYDKPKMLTYARQHPFSAGASFDSEVKKLISAQDFLSFTFKLAGFVARGAGTITTSHIKKAEQIMATMELNDDARALAIESFNKGKNASFNLNAEVDALKSRGSLSVEMITFLLEIQVQIALADGVIESEEHQRLMMLAAIFNIDSAEMERLIRIRLAEIKFAEFVRGFASREGGYSSSGSYDNSYSSGSSDNHYQRKASDSELQQAYEILGVTKDSRFDEVKKAHKRLMFKYHPDRLASQGLPPEMLKLYTQKAKDIQAAFDLIKKSKGWQ